MKSHTKRLITACFITPWVVIPVTALYSLWYLATWLGKPLLDPSGTLIWPHPFKPWESIFLYSLYGIPTAYVSLLLIGLPCYFVARKLNLLSFVSAILAAVLACIPAAVIFGRSYNFWSMFVFLLLFGIPLAVVFTWIMKDKAEQDVAPNT
jgi:hypothetical protein